MGTAAGSIFPPSLISADLIPAGTRETEKSERPLIQDCLAYGQ